MKRFFVPVILAALWAATLRADVEVLWGLTGVGGSTSNLYAFNPVGGKVVGLLPTGMTGLSGIAVHPVTKVLYATESNHGAVPGPRRLYTLNRLTGAATIIGEIGFPIADTAFRADGTLFAWRPQTNRLYTINLTTAAPTMVTPNTPSTVGSSAITFDQNGTLYMVRSNSLITVNPATGAQVAGPFVLSGATTDVDNLFARNAAGTLYVGKRGSPNTIYTITTSAVTTLVASISGVNLTGMDFGRVAPPTVKPTRATFRTKTATATLTGTASSPLYLTVSTKGKTAKVAKGKWTLKVPVKVGRTTLSLVCADAMGQKKVVKVVVVRS